MEKPSAGITYQIRHLGSTEKIPTVSVRDEGSLFGVRAIESGYFGGVAQSRCVTPADSDHKSSRGSIVESLTPSLKSRNRSTSSLVISLPPQPNIIPGRITPYSRSGSALSLNGTPRYSSPLARNPFVQDEDEISPCQVREPPQAHLSPRMQAKDEDVAMINGDYQDFENHHGEAGTRSPSVHSLTDADREGPTDATEITVTQLEEAVNEEHSPRSAPSSRAASQYSDEEAQIETATIRRMPRFPVVPQASTSSHGSPQDRRASFMYSFVPSKRSSTKSSLNHQHTSRDKHYSSFSYDEDQPELINTFAPSNSSHSSRPTTATIPPRLDLNLSIRSSFQSLFAILPTPLSTPSTRSPSNKRSMRSGRATLHHSGKDTVETPHTRSSNQSSRRSSQATTIHSASRPTSSVSKPSYYLPSGMPDAPERKVEYSRNLVAGRQEKDSNVVVNEESTTGAEIASAQTPTAPSRVLRRDGERPFFGSGIYERVSKAKKAWIEREESIGNIREDGAGSKLGPPSRGRSRNTPRPPSAVGDWGIDIFQEIDKTMLEATGGRDDDLKKSDPEDATAREEESESEAEIYGDESMSVQTRDMI